MTNETKGMLLGLFAVVGFGFTLPATKIALPFFDSVFIGFGRSVIASIFAIAFLIIFSKKMPSKKQFIQLLFVSFGVVIGFPLFATIAMEYTPASHGAIVLGIIPLATTIVGTIISNEKPSLAFWIVSVIGSLLVIIYTLYRGIAGVNIGDLSLFLAIITVSIGYAFGAKLSKELAGWQVISWAIILAVPFIIVPVLYHIPDTITKAPMKSILGFLYLAVVSQFFAFFVWYKGLSLGGIARVSQVQLLQVFITIFASILLLNEKIDIPTVIFALLVVSTVLVGKKMPIYK